jgi:hypothetical protein
VCASVEDR